MAGVSDLPFRLICREYGADIVYSEMISAKGIHYKDKKTNLLLQTDEREQPMIVQIFGCEPEIMAEAAAYIEEKGFSRLDINMGCPTPKIVSNGDGSALMRNLPLARSVIRSVVKGCHIPVSVKMRSGWDGKSKNAVALARIAEEEGAAAVTIHGRTREDFYSGTADWNIIREVKQAVTIPVIGNGDITSAESALQMFEETGCDSIMIGRGAEGNPFLFRAIREAMEGKPQTLVSAEEKRETLRRHIELLVKIKGEHIGILEARKHIAWYVKGLPNAGKLKTKAFSASSLEEMLEIIREMH